MQKLSTLIEDASPSPDSSQTLVRLQSEGAAELAALFMRLRPQLKAMIDARMQTRLASRLDSSDIVQEVFIRAGNNLGAYLANPRLHPVVWLRILGKQILVETLRYHYRGKRSPGCESDADPANVLANILSRSASGRTELERREIYLRVRELLEQMSPMDREIIEMRHVEGMSMQEAADALELNKETAKKRYQRALQRFRAISESLDGSK